MSSDKLSTAIQAVRSGNKTLGRQLLSAIVQAEPANETAWLWLSACVDGADRRQFCLERALALNPDNPHTRQALAQLKAAPPAIPPLQTPAPPAAPVASPVPVPTPALSGRPAPDSPGRPASQANPEPAAPPARTTIPVRVQPPRPTVQVSLVSLLIGLQVVILVVLTALIGGLYFMQRLSPPPLVTGNSTPGWPPLWAPPGSATPLPAATNGATPGSTNAESTPTAAALTGGGGGATETPATPSATAPPTMGNTEAAPPPLAFTPPPVPTVEPVVVVTLPPPTLTPTASSPDAPPPPTVFAPGNQEEFSVYLLTQYSSIAGQYLAIQGIVIADESATHTLAIELTHDAGGPLFATQTQAEVAAYGQRLLTDAAGFFNLQPCSVEVNEVFYAPDPTVYAGNPWYLIGDYSAAEGGWVIHRSYLKGQYAANTVSLAIWNAP